jgi:hypothetical protein
MHHISLSRGGGVFVLFGCFLGLKERDTDGEREREREREGSVLGSVALCPSLFFFFGFWR